MRRRGCLELRPFLSVLSGLTLLGGLGCSGDTAGTAPVPSAQAFWSLALNEYALNMALTDPVDTFRLTATPLTLSGTPLVGAVTFQATDSSVTVSPSGLVTARYTTPQTTVIVASTAQGVTLRDTVVIQVTPTPPPAALATFSMQPAVDDSAKRAIDDLQINNLLWTVNATDATGATICDRSTGTCPLLVHYTTSNPTVADIDPATGSVGSINGSFHADTGHAFLRASTWAYGVAKRDSVDFVVGYVVYPQNVLSITTQGGVSHVRISNGAIPKLWIVGVGAVATFWNTTTQPLNMIFAGPAAPDTASCLDWVDIEEIGSVPTPYVPPTGSGNIAAFGGDTTLDAGFGNFHTYYSNNNFNCRRFRTPGIYKYYSTLVPSDTFAFDVRIQH